MWLAYFIWTVTKGGENGYFITLPCIRWQYHLLFKPGCLECGSGLCRKDVRAKGRNWGCPGQLKVWGHPASESHECESPICLPKTRIFDVAFSFNNLNSCWIKHRHVGPLTSRFWIQDLILVKKGVLTPEKPARRKHVKNSQTFSKKKKKNVLKVLSQEFVSETHEVLNSLEFWGKILYEYFSGRIWY